MVGAFAPIYGTLDLPGGASAPAGPRLGAAQVVPHQRGLTLHNISKNIRNYIIMKKSHIIVTRKRDILMENVKGVIEWTFSEGN